MASRVLVAKVNGLGDLVAFLPTIVGIRDQLPHADIAVLAPPALEPLIQAAGVSATFLGCDPGVAWYPWRFPTSFLRLVARIRARGFGLSLNSHDERSGTLLLQSLSGITDRVGFAKSCGLDRLLTDRLPHRLDRSMAENDWQIVCWLAERTGRPPVFTVPQLHFGGTLTSFSWISSWVEDGALLVVHPSAKFTYKEWPVEHFATAIRQLLDRHGKLRVICVGTALSWFSHDRVRHATDTSIRELCHIIASADVMLCNNSGPMNLGWMLNVPLVVPTGPSPRYWDPLGGNERSEVLRAADVACMPCEGPGHVPGVCFNLANPHACLLRVSPQRAVTAVERMLDRFGGRGRDRALAAGFSR